jgi:uncharacterized protein (TIGR00369 family)
MPADADPHPQSWVPLPTDDTFAMRYDVSAGAERAVVQGFPEWLADVADSGALPAGAWCVGFDNALGSTVAVALASDERIVTSHMHVEIVRAPSPTMTEFRAIGTLVSKVSGSAFTRATMTSGGELVGMATARFAVLSTSHAGSGTVLSDATPSDPPSARPEPHPLIAGSPVHDLLRTRVLEAGAGAVRVAVEARSVFANERTGLHGGAGALFGERANDLALRTVLPHGVEMHPVELRIAFIRPIAADGRLIECRAVVVHHGRTVAATRTEVFTADGRLAMVVDELHSAGSR